MRKSVIVIHDPTLMAIHFTGTKLQGDNIWLPYDCEAGPIFPVVENLLVLNDIAHNVTRIQSIRRCGVCEEFEVTYNHKPS